ncbi:MAG: Phosphate transport system regulatory protein PhoU [Chthoniobacteraceae bacterium]|nr:Phosphate transport system regulatory protein PhoU [Chthoniobacteraceae bacterium]
MASHYEESMQRDISRIRGKIVAMAALAEQALEAVLRAFLKRDRQLAYTVILRDRRIDELEKEIDRLCLEFMVRQQPVARQLRFAYTAIKINQELERIGDYAESIARQVLKLANIKGELPVSSFEEIAHRAIPMFRDAVRAFTEEDSELALRTMVVEDEVDGIKSLINAELFALRQADKLPLEAFTPLMTVARRFERVTDQAKNICEEVTYMITGEYAKHEGGDVWRMVFIDDNNCASQIAEAIGNSLKQPQFVFNGAGLSAAPVNPLLNAFLEKKGLGTGRVIARSLEQVPNVEFSQILVALTASAKRSFPIARKALRLDWSEMKDPCGADLGMEEKEAAFEATYGFLHEQISDLCKAVLADNID